ncbi:MAG: amidohydrolase family protein [Gemmatimonadota bacterium]|nr:amidohydrolase family protein [Gemmatimonadota bacterium]
MQAAKFRVLSLAVLSAILLSAVPGWCSKRFILDSHYHARGSQEWVEQTVEIYREHNAMCCVFTLMENFELVKKAIRDYPDVFIGYGQVDPDDPNAVREIEEFHKAGFVGMKFHWPEKNWDDPKYFQLYRMCERLGLVMIFHTGVTGRFQITDKLSKSSMMRMRPGYLDLLARIFPRTIIQGAHLGNPWYEEAAEASRWNPNLYFDITGSSLPKLIRINDLARFKKILWWGGTPGRQSAFERIVFGTDARPESLPVQIENFQKFLEANEVPDSVRAKMWGLTMARILDIDPETHRFRRPRPLPPGSYPFDLEKYRK